MNNWPAQNLIVVLPNKANKQNSECDRNQCSEGKKRSLLECYGKFLQKGYWIVLDTTQFNFKTDTEVSKTKFFNSEFIILVHKVALWGFILNHYKNPNNTQSNKDALHFLTPTQK